MKFEPHPYQQIIVDHILDHPRCALWAGMGLGKTASTLTALAAFLLTVPGPYLVIAPLRVARSVWPVETRKWDHLQHLRVSPVLGTSEARRRALQKPADIYAINYDNLPWLVEHLGELWPFTIVVADESTRLRSYRTRQGGARARALATVAFRSERFIELTGTPSPQGLIDLWGQSWFLDKGERLGKSFRAFTDRWFYNISRDPQFQQLVPHEYAKTQIPEKLADLCISIDAKDWFNLQEPIRNVIRVEMPADARDLYDEMEEKLFIEIEEEGIEAANAAVKSIKCLQLANGAIYDDDKLKTYTVTHDEKIEALKSIVEEAAGMPVLVAYHFKHDLARLQKAFPKARVLDAKEQTINDWNAGRIAVMFAHPASAGHGINLQDGGNILVFFGLWWNLEEHQQIIERIGPVRQLQAGYDRPVFIHYIVAQGTVDEDVLARLKGKERVQDLLLARMKRREMA